MMPTQLASILYRLTTISYLIQIVETKFSCCSLDQGHMEFLHSYFPDTKIYHVLDSVKSLQQAEHFGIELQCGHRCQDSKWKKNIRSIKI